MEKGVLILAGGKSSRMGKEKERMKAGESTFLSLLSTRFRSYPELLISVREGQTVDLTGIETVIDVYAGCGPMGGIHAALKRCKSDALIVIPCDVPLFSTELAEYLFSKLGGEYDAVVPVTRDGLVHPLCGVYAKSALGTVERCLAEKRLRMLRLLDGLNTYMVDLSDSEFADELLTNVNTPDDYRRFCEIYKKWAKA